MINKTFGAFSGADDGERREGVESLMSRCTSPTKGGVGRGSEAVTNADRRRRKSQGRLSPMSVRQQSRCSHL